MYIQCCVYPSVNCTAIKKKKKTERKEMEGTLMSKILFFWSFFVCVLSYTHTVCANLPWQRVKFIDSSTGGE